MKTAPRYRRVLLKLSGESLHGDDGLGIDWTVVNRIAREVREVRAVPMVAQAVAAEARS